MHKGFQFLHILTNIWYFLFFYDSVPKEIKRYLIVVWICISLITVTVSIFSCDYCHLYIFFGEISIQVFCPLKMILNTGWYDLICVSERGLWCRKNSDSESEREAGGHPGVTRWPEPHWGQDGFERMDLGCAKRIRLTGFSSVVNEGERGKVCAATAGLEVVGRGTLLARALPRSVQRLVRASSLPLLLPLDSLCSFSLLFLQDPFPLSFSPSLHVVMNPCPHLVTALLLLNTSICITTAYFFKSMLASVMAVQGK